MLPGIEMMACPNLAVPASVMQHVVNVESSSNPFAIGVVGGQLVRQPQNQAEAIATAQMLESKGYNYSLGLSQVNRNNLGKYGLDSYEKAFSQCGNLEAGSRILAACYASAGGDWGKAFSCYYSGNYVTGFRTGYVQKIFDSIGRSARVAGTQTAQPIQLASDQVNPRAVPHFVTPVTNDNAAYRVAIRSSVIDTALNTLVSPAVAAASGGNAATAQSQVAPTSATAEQIQATMAQAQSQAAANTVPAPAAPLANTANAPAQSAGDSDIFEPQVRGPHERVATTGVPQAPGASAAAPAQPASDQADLREGNHDDALVF